ncbi:MAG: PEP-CTERM sorting domain-containing protein [Planctomycetota bacterium]|nr:PEP-CTERM sorting domain-containing protein [Planctomycetota bacterium]
MGRSFLGTDAVRLVGGPNFRSKEYSVPEPASASLLLLGGLALLRRRRFDAACRRRK